MLVIAYIIIVAVLIGLVVTFVSDGIDEDNWH